jgi:hypothetical protein
MCPYVGILGSLDSPNTYGSATVLNTGVIYYKYPKL